jgi:hypothetical protein
LFLLLFLLLLSGRISTYLFPVASDVVASESLSQGEPDALKFSEKNTLASEKVKGKGKPTIFLIPIIIILPTSCLETFSTTASNKSALDIITLTFLSTPRL